MFFYGFRFVNGPLLEHLQSVPARARDADRLSELFNRLSDWPDRARPGRALGALRALQEHLVREPGEHAGGSDTGRRRAAARPFALRRRHAKAPPPPPEVEEFDMATASDFSVEGVTPLDDPARPTKPGRRSPRWTRRRSPRWTEAEPQSRPGRNSIRARPTTSRPSRRAVPAKPMRNARTRRTPLQRLLSLPMLIVAAGWRSCSARCNGARRWCGISRRPPRCSAMIGMPVNLRGLIFEEREEQERIPRRCHGAGGRRHDREPDDRSTLEVPRLRFALAQRHRATRSMPGPRCRREPLLGSGDGLPFRTRLASPPPDGRDVIVRFFNRRDAALGTP